MGEQTAPERAFESSLKFRNLWRGWTREHRFDRALPTDPPGYKPRMFRADFSHESGLLVEVDGGVWTGGRHSTGAGITRDCEKTARGTLCGHRWLRFTAGQVTSGYAADTVAAYLRLEAK